MKIGSKKQGSKFTLTGETKTWMPWRTKTRPIISQWLLNKLPQLNIFDKQIGGKHGKKIGRRGTHQQWDPLQQICFCYQAFLLQKLKWYFWTIEHSKSPCLLSDDWQRISGLQYSCSVGPNHDELYENWESAGKKGKVWQKSKQSSHDDC